LEITVPDIRLAVRLFRTTPVVTVVAVLSLALGIGANTAIFSIADSLLLRPLPVVRPEQLVLLNATGGSIPGFSNWSNPVWEQIRERRHELFETAFAFSARPARFDLASGGSSDLVDGLWASGDYFEALGVPPVLGRTFTDDDDRRGGGPNGPVAVISYGFWQRRFGASADVVGRALTLDRVPFTVIGVMPPRFFGAEVGRTFDVAVPLGTEPLMRGRNSFLDTPTTSWLAVMARLKGNQTTASAQQALRSVQPYIRNTTMPPSASADGQTRYMATPFAVEPAVLGTSAMRTRYQRPVQIILAVVALVLLVACANIANLFLARAAARKHELSMRLALGASRWRLFKQLLVESLLLAVAGALVGLALAWWGTGALVRQLSTPASTVFLDAQLDLRVLAFTLVVTTIAAFLFGVLPAWRASRSAPFDAIREHGRADIGDRRVGLGGALVVGQVALSLVLVVTAGLFLRTFASLAMLDLGFDPDPVLIARVDVSGSVVEPGNRAAFYERVAEGARAVAGISDASASTITPVSGGIVDAVMEIESGPTLTLPQNVSYKNVITPQWFATYGMHVISGRDFNAHDRLASPLVAIVNEAFVHRFVPDSTPIGRSIRQGPSERQGPWLEIVGVVANSVYRSLRDPVPPTFFVPLGQQQELPPTVSISIRAASGPPAALTRSVGEALARIDRNMAITFTPLKQQVDAALVQERMLAMLSGLFGVLALLLAGLGLYGLMWQAVSRRRNEIGVRMALGATPAAIVRLVFARVATLVGSGVVLGLAVTRWASTFVTSLLYGVEPHDVGTIVWSVVVLVVAGAAAAWLPTYGALRIDPAAVLREH
jgi:putative ABC transport system permease protein